MMSLEGTAAVWLVYLTALLLFLLVCWWVLNPIFNRRVVSILMLVAAIVMATPFGVPGAEGLAPAWLVAIFQFATGDQKIAVAALQPIAVLLVAFFVAFIVVLLLRKRAPPRAT